MRISAALSDTSKKEILGILLVALAVFVGISLFSYDKGSDNQLLKEYLRAQNLPEIFSKKFNNQCGAVGAGASFLIFYALGYSGFFMPLFLVLLGISCFQKVRLARVWRKVLFAFIFVLSLGTLLILPTIGSQQVVDFSQVTTGGWVTRALGEVFLKVLGGAGSYVLIVASLIVLSAMITPFRPSALVLLFRGMTQRLLTQGRRWQELRRVHRQRVQREKELQGRRKPELAFPEVETGVTSPQKPTTVTRVPSSAEEKASITLLRREQRRVQGGYEFPSLDFLDDPPYEKPSVSEEELNETARILKQTLSTFGVEIEGESIEIYPGPVITRYEFKPAAGIKVNQVVNLSDDLALAMRARKVRIVVPVPGKAAIGVEIPNKNSQTVYLKEILTSSAFQDAQPKLSLALGKTSSGEPFVTDLGKMPHLLIAGATGSGKSVCINAIITSLLYRLAPEEIRFVMIDPKMLELTVYEGLPHLERSVITNPKVSEHVLSEIVTEMEQRYRQLAECGVRNIEDFNKRQSQEDILPYIIIIVDELADLMMSSSTRVESLITRLAQMARAVGIHLILATQRPSVDVITGLIKANFSARIAFQVASKIDSRTILDTNGAEKLLGSGDMLFIETGHPEPRRLHGAYISSDETARIVDFIKGQAYSVEPIDILSAEPEEVISQQETAKDDDLFQRAAELVIRHKQGSVSLLQRRLAVGYQRAARLIDQLEEEGIVGPYDGSKAREVLVDGSYLETPEWTERKSRSQNHRGNR